MEEAALSLLPSTLPFYFRYVDDILLAAPNDLLENILETFNSFHDRLKFTMEISTDNRINFLDVTLIIENGVIMFDHYKKPTNSGRYLNFMSNHPLEHKRGVIFYLFDRVLQLSHPRFHTKNLEESIRVLINNGYPLKFIFSTINNRLYHLIKNGIKVREKTDLADHNFFTIPYINGISEKFRNLAKKHKFNLSFLSTNSLQKYIKTGKDQLSTLSCCGVVYKINCNNCDASYVGQTKRSKN